MPATLTELFLQAWSEFNNPGLEESGRKRPSKAELRALGAAIEARDSALAAAIVAAGGVAKATRALLYADLAHGAGVIAVVYDDDVDDAYDGFYLKLLGTGTGSWTYIDIFTGKITEVAQPFVDAAEAAQAAAELARDEVVDVVVRERGPAMTLERDPAGWVSKVETPVRSWTPAMEAARVREILSRNHDLFGTSGLVQIAHRTQSEGHGFNAWLGVAPYNAASETPLPYGYAFAGETRITTFTLDGGSPTGYAETASLTPYAEKINEYPPPSADNPFGETHGAGFMMGWNDMLRRTTGRDMVSQRANFLTAFTAGNDISSAGVLTDTLMRLGGTMEAGPVLARPAHLEWRGVLFGTDSQGYRDQQQGVAAATYGANVLTFWDGVAAKNLVELGRPVPITVAILQLDTHHSAKVTASATAHDDAAGVAVPVIAWQQLEMETWPGFCRLETRFQAEMMADNIHPTAWANFEYGWRMARQAYVRRVLGLDGFGLRAGQAEWDSTELFIPIDALDCSRFDGMALLPSGLTDAPAKLSFEVLDGDGDDFAFTTAELVTADGRPGVLLTAAGAFPTELTWYHARAGDARRGIGGVRDNDDRFAIGQGGRVIPLHAYLPICKGTYSA